ncbi:MULTISPECIES: hypothetical protein [Xanthomonas]|uniref:hypothetical protein n=1 Tax=Xanthomonas TaxID=338 RepID=UPI00186ADCB7|nr:MULTISPECIES: hypothetical protein [Xanthomonas]MCW0392891.1 hypothetical protein [Xanthomonas sacchari]MCW0436428.1 hypothetical protein [Xanthomonas sacchari]
MELPAHGAEYENPIANANEFSPIFIGEFNNCTYSINTIISIFIAYGAIVLRNLLEFWN